MRVYLDSSALLKRAVNEPESEAFQASLDVFERGGAVLMSSTLAWIEVSRAVRLRRDLESPRLIIDMIDIAMSGIEECPINAQVVGISQRLNPTTLRSLDAIHLASASILAADLICGYDRRLLAAAEELGFRTLSPGLAA